MRKIIASLTLCLGLIVGCAADPLTYESQSQPDMVMTGKPDLTRPADLTPLEKPDLTPPAPPKCIDFPYISHDGGKGDQILIAASDKNFLTVVRDDIAFVPAPARTRPFNFDGTVMPVGTMTLDPSNGMLRGLTYSHKYGNFLLSTMYRDGQNYQNFHNGTMRLDWAGSIAWKLGYERWAGTLFSDAKGDLYASAGWSVNYDASTAGYFVGEVDQSGDLAANAEYIMQMERCNFMGGVVRFGDMIAFTGVSEKRDIGQFTFDLFFTQNFKILSTVNIATAPGIKGLSEFNCTAIGVFTPIGLESVDNGRLAVIWRDQRSLTTKVTYVGKGGKTGEHTLPSGLKVRRVKATPNNFVMVVTDEDRWNPKTSLVVVDREGRQISSFDTKMADVVTKNNVWLDRGDNVALAVSPDGRSVALGTSRDSDNRVGFSFFHNTCP